MTFFFFLTKQRTHLVLFIPEKSALRGEGIRKKEKRKEVLVSFKFYFFDVVRVAQVLLLKKEEEEEKPCVIAHKPLLAVIKLYSVVRGRLGVKMQPTYGSTRQICKDDRQELCCHLSLLSSNQKEGETLSQVGEVCFPKEKEKTSSKMKSTFKLQSKCKIHVNSVRGLGFIDSFFLFFGFFF